MKAASLFFHDGEEDGSTALSRVLLACSSTLLHLAIGSYFDEELPSINLQCLEYLRVHALYNSEHLLHEVRFPSLKHVEISQESIIEVSFKIFKPESMIITVWDDRTGEGAEDDSLTETENLIQIIKRQESSLEKLQLRKNLSILPPYLNFSSVDFFLRTLQVGLALPPSYPILRYLSITKDLVFNVDLLTEVLFSRHLSSKGHNTLGMDE